MSNQNQRNIRIQTAQQTLRIIENGNYSSAGKKRVNIADEQWLAEKNAQLIRPADWPSIHAKAMAQPRVHQLQVSIANETTFAAARRMRQLGPVLALNFASARNPGGGFLSGAQAQEEALSRGSGLYPTLTKHSEYYDYNRANRSLLYSDYMIYSPEVPVFRDDADQLLDESYTVSILTSPAPNRGAIEQNKTGEEKKIPETFQRRIGLLLSFAAANGYHRLILGAWGCGAFQNKPADVSVWFRDQLLQNSDFKGLFSEVHFAILDYSKEGKFIQPFRDTFNLK